MNTHPHIAARFVTELDTSTIIEARVRNPSTPERIWIEVFGPYGRPVPQGFRSPSESWPALRRWAH